MTPAAITSAIREEYPSADVTVVTLRHGVMVSVRLPWWTGELDAHESVIQAMVDDHIDNARVLVAPMSKPAMVVDLLILSGVLALVVLLAVAL